MAQPVENFAAAWLQQLIDELIETAISSQGVGIAAPQVAQPYRLFIVASHPNFRYPQAPQMPPTPMLNPEIIAHSETITLGNEGCLSIPGKRGLVPRYAAVTVAYQDRYGNLQQQVFEGFVARIIQHELDHLDGILFVDRALELKDSNR
ncbi:MAG: peptide deformylase [Jaaginema sp. PMC 1079.18]|nr:peptide deformylase [Jaaginema sp. PMC 1080.18]MEC4849366.1 peptide deformylase [Jaaginema sp. PMC 1079.18]MEC4865399.1 peptide deformylase [Jaaginema sp. PMC 1078.18]